MVRPEVGSVSFLPKPNQRSSKTGSWEMNRDATLKRVPASASATGDGVRRKLPTPAEMERLGEELFEHEKLKPKIKVRNRVYAGKPTIEMDMDMTEADENVQKSSSYFGSDINPNYPSKSKVKEGKKKTERKNKKQRSKVSQKTDVRESQDKRKQRKGKKGERGKDGRLKSRVQKKALEPNPVDSGLIPNKTVSREVDIVFPPLRCVLWDRRLRSSQSIITLGAEIYIPKVVFRRPTLASLYHKVQLKSEEKEMRQRSRKGNDQGYLTLEGRPTSGVQYGDVGEWAGGTWELTIDTCSCHNHKWKNGVARILVLCKDSDEGTLNRAKDMIDQGGYEKPFLDQSENALESSMSFTADEYSTIVQRVRTNLEVNGPPSPIKAFNFFATAAVLPGSRLLFRCEVVLPAVTLNFKPISPLPILYTPLAKYLENWNIKRSSERFETEDTPSNECDPSDSTCCGFITLNQTRKAVLLLEDDPNAYTLPLVGVWIRVNSLPSSGILEKQSWQEMIQDPMILHVCMRYLHNNHISERVCPQGATATTLLMLLYPRNCKEPIFLEVEILMKSQSPPLIQFETGFEIDIGRASTRFFPGNDSVGLNFFNVQDIKRRTMFREKVNEAFPSQEEDNEDPTTLTLDEVGDEEEYLMNLEDFGCEAASQLFVSPHDSVDNIEHFECSVADDSYVSDKYAEKQVSMTSFQKDEDEVGVSKVSGYKISKVDDSQDFDTIENKSYRSIIMAQQEQMIQMQRQIQKLQELMESQLTKTPLLGDQGEAKSVIRSNGPGSMHIEDKNKGDMKLKASKDQNSDIKLKLASDGTEVENLQTDVVNDTSVDSGSSAYYVKDDVIVMKQDIKGAEPNKAIGKGEQATALYLKGLTYDEDDTVHTSLNKSISRKSISGTVVNDHDKSDEEEPSLIKLRAPSESSKLYVELNIGDDLADDLVPLPSEPVDQEGNFEGISGKDSESSFASLEADTMVGIPQIKTSRNFDSKFYSDSEGEDAEEETWMARIEEKYLKKNKE